MSDTNGPPPDLGITEADWQQTPPSVRAVVRALHQRPSKLEEQLQLNSDNSSQPPASDQPRHQREKKGKLPSGKKRGGQRGHRGHSRHLAPPEAVSEFQVYKPEHCRHCGETLSSDDPAPTAGR